VARLQSDLQKTQTENTDLQAKLTQAVAARKEADSRLQEAVAKLTESDMALSRIRRDSRQLQTEKQEMETQLSELTANRTKSETRLKEAADRFARAEETIASLRAESTGGSAAREDLEAKLRELMSGHEDLQMKLDIVESERAVLKTQLASAVNAKAGLEEQIRKLQGELQSGQSQPPAFAAATPASAPPSKGNPEGATVSQNQLDQEVARIQAMLAEVAKLIDDPATALSTVMRKNAEKTELESYLNGIRFALGKGGPR
jgi:chromosome segregation ATPase